MGSATRIAYVKSGNVVEALERMAARGEAPQDDGGPDGFLGDLLGAARGESLLLIGISGTARGNRCRREPQRRVHGITLATRRRLGRLRSALRVVRELLRFRPQRVICGKCGSPLWASFLAARLLRVPFIHSRHNWPAHPSLAGRLGAAIDERIVRRAQAVLCHGPYLRDRLLASGVPRERLFEFDSGSEALVAGLAEPPAAGARQVLFVGRITARKGVFDLLEACTRLFPDHPELELVYAGDGNELERLRDEVARRGVGRRVQLLGRVDHLAVGRLMRAARLVVTPTRSDFPEGRCMVAMEALAVGVPVVAPRCGPFPYLVRHGENGLLYTPDAVGEMSEAIRHLYQDDPLHARLAAGARAAGAELLRPRATFAQALGRALALGGGPLASPQPNA